MPAFLEKHYSLDLKKSAEFGPDRKVYTLINHEISYGREKSAKKLILTPLSGDNRKNQAQWDSLRSTIEKENLLLFSFRQLSPFFPSDEYPDFARRKLKSSISIAMLLEMFLPFGELTSPEETALKLNSLLPKKDQIKEISSEKLLAAATLIIGMYDRSLLSNVARLLSTSGALLAKYLEGIKGTGGELPKELSEHFPLHFFKYTPPDNDIESSDGDTEGHLDSVFSGDGKLAQILSDYEKRPEQLQFAKLFSRALRNKETFLAEAGTGTGKSLAYLIPLLLNTENEKKSVIATFTRTLQDQLFFKDLRIAAEAALKSFTASLLKGRANYLCLLKKAMLSGRVSKFLSSSDFREMARVEIWESLTKSGDLSEIKLESGRVKAEICADANFCLRQACQFYSRCYFYKARKQAFRADLIVANQALFFTDLLAGGNVLGKRQNVVFDEAHRLEKVATSHLSAELNRLHPLAILAYLKPGRKQEQSLVLRIIDDILFEFKDAPDSPLTQMQDQIETGSTTLQSLINRVFERLADFITSHGYRAESFSIKIRFDDQSEIYRIINSDLREIQDELQSLMQNLKKLKSLISEIELEQPQQILFEELNRTMSELAEISQIVRLFIESDTHFHVFWLELPVRSEVKLCLAPMQVGNTLKELIYDTYDCVLLTSASLSVEGFFEFYEKSVGLDLIEPERIIRKSFGSSFDFYRQIEFFCTAFVSSPKSEYYSTSLARLLSTLLPALRRKSLILFTSYQLLFDIYNQISSKLLRSGFDIYAQGISGSPEQILKKYRESSLAAILGTDSFWEGIDLPGNQLELLVITRLPFSSPGEPIEAARMEALEERGESSFVSYSLPNAVLKFKQGFGRLIRQRTDTGLIFVTDNRLVKSNFGQIFLNSVPAELNIIYSLEELSGKLDIL